MWFTDLTTYTRKLTSPDGEEGSVTLRPLNSGDRTELNDTVRAELGEEGAANAELRLGTMQLLTIERAIVSWDLPGSTATPTRATIQALHPNVYDQIFEYVSWGSVPPEPTEDEDPTRDESEPVPPPESAELVASS